MCVRAFVRACVRVCVCVVCVCTYSCVHFCVTCAQWNLTYTILRIQSSVKLIPTVISLLKWLVVVFKCGNVESPDSRCMDN